VPCVTVGSSLVKVVGRAHSRSNVVGCVYQTARAQPYFLRGGGPGDYFTISDAMKIFLQCLVLIDASQ